MMQITGSPAFIARTQEALAVWRETDPDHADQVFSAIRGIQESDEERFCAFTRANGIITLCRDMAFWPGLEAASQRDIYATYLAHEGIHAWLLDCGSRAWNTDQAESEALRYQKCLAETLGVPIQYIVNPETTVKDFHGPQANFTPLMILGILGATAIGLQYVSRSR